MCSVCVVCVCSLQTLINTILLFHNTVGCILTTLLLKQCVDPVKHHGDIVKLFSSLSEVDPYRHGYYADLCKHILLTVPFIRVLLYLLDLCFRGTIIFCPETRVRYN